MQTSLLLDHRPAGGGRIVVHALLRVESAPPPTGPRPPLDLVLLLDRSGSMWGEKLEAARRAVLDILARLGPEDRVGVVAFDSEPSVLWPPPRGRRERRREELPRLVREIHPGVEARPTRAWLRGCALLRGVIGREGIGRLVLLTDGLNDEGPAESGQLRRLAAQARIHGILTTTVAFGKDPRDTRLDALARAGGGGCWHVRGDDDVDRLYRQELSNPDRTTIRDLRVFVHPDRHAAAVKVLHDDAAAEQDGVLILDLDDVRPNAGRTLLLEFLVPAEAPPEAWLATLTVQGTVTRRSGMPELLTVDLPIRFEAGNGGAVDPEVRREVMRELGRRGGRGPRRRLG